LKWKIRNFGTEKNGNQGYNFRIIIEMQKALATMQGLFDVSFINEGYCT
jgi:hypothetical protein